MITHVVISINNLKTTAISARFVFLNLVEDYLT